VFIYVLTHCLQSPLPPLRQILTLFCYLSFASITWPSAVVNHSPHPQQSHSGASQFPYITSGLLSTMIRCLNHSGVLRSTSAARKRFTQPLVVIFETPKTLQIRMNVGLNFKHKGRWLDSWWGHWIFYFTKSCRGVPGSKPGLGMLDLWWTKWRWGRFSPNTLVSPTNLYSTKFSTITIIYLPGLVQ
jgi:hypothetical protein